MNESSRKGFYLNPIPFSIDSWRFKYNSLFIITLFLFTFNINAQNSSLLNRDLSQIEVEELTDSEVNSILIELEKSGLSEAELEQLALLNNMPQIELQKLRKRLEGIQKDTLSNSTYQSNQQYFKQVEDPNLSKKETFETSSELSKVYGSTLFNNRKLTFEPSLSMNPPNDYKLGAGDQLIIDVWGASRNYFEQTIDRNGTIRIDNVGPVQIAGYTLSQAENKIIDKLAQIYSGLTSSSPNTFAQISLGRLKNIKVSLIGEVQSPGTYTLPSLASAFNALYLSGGPSILGSFRNIEIIRNQKIVAKMDVYDFLLKGTSSGNIQLKDQDLIRIPTYQKRIEIIGEVKRPGLYEVTEGEALTDLITFAGGFTKQAYTNRLSVQRYSSKERLVQDILPEQRDTFQLHNGDELTIGSILNRFKNRVTISGAVFREGEYELTPSLTVKDLILKADGVKPSAFMERGEIIRELPDQSMEIISFDVSKLLKGEINDIELKREDAITISSIYDLQEDYEVRIDGDVQKPGSYPYYKNMSLQALILRAGGFIESASVDRIEIARRVTEGNGENSNEIAKLFQFEVSEDLTINSNDEEFIINPYDQVYIRRAPSYEVQKSVYLQGNIKFPGAYVLEKKNERISDLVLRAGGLNEFAYPEGARLVRSYENKTENIGIKLHAILKKPHSSEDLFLLPGDRLIIPKELQTVRINGEVLFPVSTRFQKSKKLKKYINNAGGYSNDAIRRKTIIRYANGYVKNTSNFLGIKFYPKVEPGAEIIVPTRPEKRKISGQEIIGWTTGIATLGLILVNILQANP
jgi:protein involved in polysaccharide export with SLBB domain